MNLTEFQVWKECRWDFLDLPSSDWGCKYAEEALDRGFIAENDNFRPDDYVTEVEALKMISQAKGIIIYENESEDNWWDKYIASAKSAWILRDFESVTITYAKRSKIFYMWTRTFSDSWENTIIKWTYLGYFYGFWHVIEIDEKLYPFVHSMNGIIGLGDEMPFIIPGTNISFKLISQNLFPSYEGMYHIASKVEVLDGIYKVWESVFDNCWDIMSYKDEEWYNLPYHKIDEISELCFSKDLWFVLYATQDNFVWMYWLGLDSNLWVSSMPFKLNIEENKNHSFVEFWKRNGEIIPIKFKDIHTEKMVWIEYNFIQHEVINN